MLKKSDVLNPLSHFDVPESVKLFLLKPPRLKLFNVPLPEEIGTKEEFSPDLPPQFLPLMRRPTGHAIGLYFLPALTANADSPTAIVAVEQSGLIIPLDGNIERFLANPDKYSCDHKANNGEWPKPLAKKVWKKWLYDFKSATPELELLKPLTLNSSGFAKRKRDKPRFRKIITRFGSASGVAELIRRYMTTSEDVIDRTCWLKLANRLLREKHYIEALRALDNCRLTSYNFPDYGYRHGSPDWELRIQDNLALLSKMQPVFNKHGTPLEKINISHLIWWTESQIALTKKTYPEPKKEPERQVMGVNLSICLADVLNMDDKALRQIEGIDDANNVIRLLPISQTSNRFMLELGSAVALSFEFKKGFVPLGEVLSGIASFCQEEYFVHKAKYRTHTWHLSNTWAIRLQWSWSERKESNYWYLVTDKRKVKS